MWRLFLEATELGDFDDHLEVRARLTVEIEGCPDVGCRLLVAWHDPGERSKDLVSRGGSSRWTGAEVNSRVLGQSCPGFSHQAIHGYQPHVYRLFAKQNSTYCRCSE